MATYGNQSVAEIKEIKTFAGRRKLEEDLWFSQEIRIRYLSREKDEKVASLRRLDKACSTIADITQ